MPQELISKFKSRTRVQPLVSVNETLPFFMPSALEEGVAEPEPVPVPEPVRATKKKELPYGNDTNFESIKPQVGDTYRREFPLKYRKEIASYPPDLNEKGKRKETRDMTEFLKDRITRIDPNNSVGKFHQRQIMKKQIAKDNDELMSENPKWK